MERGLAKLARTPCSAFMDGLALNEPIPGGRLNPVFLRASAAFFSKASAFRCFNSSAAAAPNPLPSS